MALSDYLISVARHWYQNLKLSKTNMEKDKGKRMELNKPLVSPEYLCNPLEGNIAVTAHSVLHQDPETQRL